MRVLVTGGRGFIGTYVAENLAARGIVPIALDHKQRVIVEPYDESFFGDVRDFTAVMEAVGTCNGVIHLAAVLGTQETVHEPTPAVETNIFGSLNVFRAAKHYRVPVTYAAVGNHWMNNSYSITKTTAERFAFMANKEWGTRIAVVRALNAYGPRQKAAPVRKIMPNLVLPALRNEAITIYGDGEQVMDMIHVRDVAEAMVRGLLEDHGNYDSPFEIGTGRPTTVNQVANEVIKAAGGGWLHHVEMRPGEVPNSVVLADPDTLAPMGLKADDLITLEEGVPETVEWYRSPTRTRSGGR